MLFIGKNTKLSKWYTFVSFSFLYYGSSQNANMLMNVQTIPFNDAALCTLNLYSFHFEIPIVMYTFKRRDGYHTDVYV